MFVRGGDPEQLRAHLEEPFPDAALRVESRADQVYWVVPVSEIDSTTARRLCAATLLPEASGGTNCYLVL